MRVSRALQGAGLRHLATQLTLCTNERARANNGTAVGGAKPELAPMRTLVASPTRLACVWLHGSVDVNRFGHQIYSAVTPGGGVAMSGRHAARAALIMKGVTSAGRL